MHDKIKSIIEENDLQVITTADDWNINNLSVERLFFELEQADIINWSVYYREDANGGDSWLQAEYFEPKLSHTIIIDYNFPDFFESIEDIETIIDRTNAQIAELQAKLK